MSTQELLEQARTILTCRMEEADRHSDAAALRCFDYSLDIISAVLAEDATKLKLLAATTRWDADRDSDDDWDSDADFNEEFNEEFADDMFVMADYKHSEYND